MRFLFAMLLLFPAQSFAAYKVYLKSGSTGTLGTSTSPVGTFDSVKTLILQANTSEDIEIHIFPGLYVGQRMHWDIPIRPGQKITFRQWEGQSGWPHFIGTGLKGKSFFSLSSDVVTGGATNFRFWHLDIEGYKDGIILPGSRRDFAAYNSNNEIMDCRFSKIGDLHVADAGGPGYAVINLVNSRDNKIYFNRFEGIENKLPLLNQYLIHGIYAAHWSSDNDIRFNYFSVVSGDPIKTRDTSGKNIVRGNAFWKTGYSTQFSDWYCNAQLVGSCRQASDWENLGSRWECPSFDNDFRYNSYGKDYDNLEVLPGNRTVSVESNPDYTAISGFPAYSCPPNSGVRFFAAGNDYINSWAGMTAIFTAWESPTGVITNWRSANGIR